MIRRQTAALLMAIGLAVPLHSALAQEAVTVQIGPTAGFSVSGTAVLTPKGDKTSVMLKLQGFPASPVHPTHFHTGTCAQAGPPVIPLPDLSANAQGAAEATADVDAPISMLMDGNHFIMTHVGPTAVGPGLVAVACGDVPKAAQSVPTRLPRSGGPDALAVALAAAGLLGAGALLRRRPASHTAG